MFKIFIGLDFYGAIFCLLKWYPYIYRKLSFVGHLLGKKKCHSSFGTHIKVLGDINLVWFNLPYLLINRVIVCRLAPFALVISPIIFCLVFFTQSFLVHNCTSLI